MGDQARKEFERWAKPRMNLDRDDLRNGYRQFGTQCAWEAWQGTWLLERPEMKPARWFRVQDAKGDLWLETSNQAEAKAGMRPGDSLFRLYEGTASEWRPVPEVDRG